MWRWFAFASAAIGGCGFSAPNDAVDARPPGTPVTCGSQYAMKLGGHSYRFTTSSKTWSNAKADCDSDGGHLIKIEDQVEDDELRDAVDALEHPFVWLGLFDPIQNDMYRWSDGTMPAYQNWDSGDPPSHATWDCVAKSTADFDGQWYAVECGTEMRTWCECDGP